MSVRQVGDVTNLCRQRRNQNVTTGIVTETGPYIPVSLGFSMVEDNSDSWEEMVDENGVSIGVEVRSFRLNIINGSTETIDEDISNIRRICGADGGTNSRWDAETGMKIENDWAA